MNKILITGVSGFIGRSLAKKLLKNGNLVYGVDVFFDEKFELYRYPNFIPIKVEKDNFNAIDQEKINNLNIVYHLGWAGQLGGLDLYNFELQLSNIIMTERLIQKLLTIGIDKFVFCGSISHYKYLSNMSEDIHSDIYGLSKMYAGKLALNILSQKNISVNVALLANTYGIGDYSNKAVNTLIRKILKGENLVLIDANVLNDWVYIDDTVKGLISVGERGLNYKEYYIGHRIIPTFENNMRAMKKALHSDIKLQFGGYSDKTIADYSKVNLEELYNDTGFECQCDIIDSIEKTALWLKNKELK